ncbi:MAG: HPr family phosphocarrier protein [Anaerolineales bacterium]|nr:HPr family phosphocarrier protein [Anaerolineales bacterium]
MHTIRCIVNHAEGLHMRPAKDFVQRASEYESEITVANITKESAAVNAKSYILVLTLGVSQGHEIEIVADGTDEQDVVAALRELIENNFGEKAASAAS